MVCDFQEQWHGTAVQDTGYEMTDSLQPYSAHQAPLAESRGNPGALARRYSLRGILLG